MKHLAAKKYRFATAIALFAAVLGSWVSVARPFPFAAENAATWPSGYAPSKVGFLAEPAACPGEPNQDRGQEGATGEESCRDAMIEPVRPGDVPAEPPGFVLDPEAMIDRTEIQDPGAPDTEEGQTPLPEVPVDPTEESR